MSKPDLAKLSAPQALAEHHRLDRFVCAESSLSAWLTSRAWRNEQTGASRTYVVCAGDDVVGYYCLSAGAVAHAEAPGRIGRSMPDPIPAVVLGPLAVHLDCSGRGIGTGLLKDALLRSANAARTLGVRAMLVHAISDDAQRFYLKHGFVSSPLSAMTLMLGLHDLG